MAKFRDHLYWILRRAGSGFLAGLVAWFFIPALSRVISQQVGPAVHFLVVGLLGGAFLGTVDGMVEESTPKMFRGAVMGGIGGAIGGLIFGSINLQLTSEQTPWGLFGFWAIAGAMIGVVSAQWERKAGRLLAGIFSGAIGGGIGGALGYAVYAYLVQEFDPQGWGIRRLCEGFSGGIIGLVLWFSIAVAERFIIFKRRLIEGKNHKHCEQCETQNPLNTWYCRDCGSVLQQSAPPASLNLSPHVTLERVREFFRLLSRLSAVTGMIAGVVVFVVFLPVHKILAIVALVLVSVASYSLLILFSSVAESLQILMKK